MGERTEIAWCDATFNPWIGCTEISPGCEHCYARGLSRRFAPNLWGADAERKLMTDAYWSQPLAWQRRAIKEGTRPRVFCASMSDVFDNHPAVSDSRNHLWELILRTPRLDWLVLTKRIGNVSRMLPPDWGDGYPNVWLGISVVNQEEADRDIPKLTDTPAARRFISAEPLLGPLDLYAFQKGRCAACGGTGGAVDVLEDGAELDRCRDCMGTGLCEDNPGLDWIIVGGESGANARPLNIDWALGVQHFCVHYGVPFFMKQGSQANWAGFRNFASFPKQLQVRQWPRSTA
jgi:protein gp37